VEINPSARIATSLGGFLKSIFCCAIQENDMDTKSSEYKFITGGLRLILN
jgi:hypothetical protein